MATVQTYKAQPDKEYIPQVNNGEIITNTLQNVSTAVNKLTQVNNDVNKIKSNSILSELQTQQAILTEDYKLKNKHDPDNKQAYEEYRNKYNTLTNDYLSRVPASAKNYFISKQSQLKTQNKNQLDIWKFQQKLSNTEKDITNGIMSLTNQVKEGGKNNIGLGDILLIAENQKNLIVDSAITVLGEAKGRELTNNLNSDLVTSYISGLMINNPAQAYNYLQDDSIIRIIGDDKIVKTLQDASANRMKSFADYQTQKDLANLTIQDYKTVRDIFNQDIDFAELNNYLELNKDNMTTHTRNYLLKLSGFKLDDDGSGSGSGSLKVKPTARQKLEALNDLLNIELLTNFEESKEKGKLINDWKDKVFEYVDKEFITPNEANKWLEVLNNEAGKITRYNNQETYDINHNWFITNSPAKKIDEFVNSIFEERKGSNTLDKLKDQTASKEDTNQYLQMRAHMQNILSENLKEGAENMARLTNTNIEDYGSVKDFINSLPLNKRDRIVNDAVALTKKDYLRSKGYSVDNKTDEEISNKIKEVEQQEIYNNISDQLFLRNFNQNIINDYGK